MLAADILGANASHAKSEDTGEFWQSDYSAHAAPKVPNGLAALGYTGKDIPALVNGTLPQHRVTKLSPRSAGEEELTKLFEESMVIW